MKIVWTYRMLETFYLYFATDFDESEKSNLSCQVDKKCWNSIISWNLGNLEIESLKLENLHNKNSTVTVYFQELLGNQVTLLCLRSRVVNKYEIVLIIIQNNALFLEIIC